MAKRKRLTPARMHDLASSEAAMENTLRRPPIAQVAADAATNSALRELSDELTHAREEGRMVLSLPLDEVVENHLARDRVSADGEAKTALMISLRERGQQTPIEVQQLAKGGYGLISGWRRLQALRSLHSETGDDRFGVIQALIRRPKDQAAAYVAMIEENEIRADLSFYERARIVRIAVDTGVFETEKQALQSLFSTASYAKRSKIKSFLTLVDALDDILRFPAHISERSGLALVQALNDKEGAIVQISAALKAAAPETPEAEAKILAGLIAAKQTKRKVPALRKSAKKMPKPHQIANGIGFSAVEGRVELTGDRLSPDLIERLRIWLSSQT